MQKNEYNVFELCLSFRECTFSETPKARMSCDFDFMIDFGHTQISVAKSCSVISNLVSINGLFA